MKTSLSKSKIHSTTPPPINKTPNKTAASSPRRATSSTIPSSPKGFSSSSHSTRNIVTSMASRHSNGMTIIDNHSISIIKISHCYCNLKMTKKSPSSSWKYTNTTNIYQSTYSPSTLNPSDSKFMPTAKKESSL